MNKTEPCRNRLKGIWGQITEREFAGGKGKGHKTVGESETTSFGQGPELRENDPQIKKKGGHGAGAFRTR